MGGSISVESELKKGSTFTIILQLKALERVYRVPESHSICEESIFPLKESFLLQFKELSIKQEQNPNKKGPI